MAQENQIDEPDQKYYQHRRMVYSIHLLSMELNLTFRILNGNGYDDVMQVWSEYKAPIHDLEQLIQKPDFLADPLNETIDEKLWYWLYPLYKIESIESDKDKREEAEGLDHKLSFALWKTDPSNIKPLYREMTRYFPEIVCLTKLHYLRLLWQIKEKTISMGDKTNNTYQYQNPDGKNIEEFTNPIGLSERMLLLKPFNKLYDNDILLAGEVWLREDIEKNIDKRYLSLLLLSLEEYVRKRIEKYQNYFKRNLTYSELAFLFTRFRLHSLINKSIFKKKTEIAWHTLKALNKIEECFLSDISLHTSEWRNVVRCILFLYSDQTQTIFKQYSNKIKPSLDSKLPKLEMPLAEREDRNTYFVSTDWNYPKNKETSTQFEQFDFRLLIKEQAGKASEFWIQYENYSEPELIQNMAKELERFYYLFLEENFLRQSNKQHIFFDQLRHDLQHGFFKNISTRYENIARGALQLSMADMVIYTRYNGLSNTLEPVALFRDRFLEKKDLKQEQEDKRQAEKKLKDKYERLAHYHKLREISSTYRCLDNLSVISRFDPIGKKNNQPKQSPFSITDKIEDNVSGIEIEHDWFKDEKNPLVIPIMFYGRKQGVLYLTSKDQFHFILQDCFLLLKFVQTFETEIFQSRLIDTLTNINTSLGKVLRGDIHEDDFFNKLSEHIAILLGAAGVSILWDVKYGSSELKILGYAGDKLNDIFSNDALSKYQEDHTVKDLFSKQDIQIVTDIHNKGSFGERLYKNDLKGYIQVPMINREKTIGLIIVHDREELQTSLSSAHFEKELNFLGQQIQQILSHYFEHTGKIEDMMILIGHELDSVLYSIQNCYLRLKEFNVPDQYKDSYEKRLEDIARYVEHGHILFDYLNKKSIQGNIEDIEHGDPLLEFVYHLGIHLPLKEPTNIYEIIKTSLHSKLPEFEKEKIKFETEIEIISPLWVHERVFQDVFTNLIDNISKYGEPNKTFNVIIKKTYSEWQIITKNTGAPLDDEAKGVPNIVFHQGKRCSTDSWDKDRSKKGNGMGLFIARTLARSWGGDLRLIYKHKNQYSEYEFILTFPMWLAKKENPWENN